MYDNIQWTAWYRNGTKLSQRDEDGYPHAYEDIDREELAFFDLNNVEEHTVILRVDFMQHDDGRKLIWRRRVQKRDDGTEIVVHILGKKGQYVALVFEDGSVSMYDNFREDIAILAPVQPVAGES